MPHYTALVTLFAVAFYFYAGLCVGQARRKYGIKAPAMAGNPDFERVVRVQMNTLEWMPIFLPCLWLFAFYVGDLPAAVLGVIWIVGRYLYLTGYTAAADKRFTGFMIQALAASVLMLGALVAIVMRLVNGG